jgi:hypothetical protein
MEVYFLYIVVRKKRNKPNHKKRIARQRRRKSKLYAVGQATQSPLLGGVRCKQGALVIVYDKKRGAEIACHYRWR